MVDAAPLQQGVQPGFLPFPPEGHGREKAVVSWGMPACPLGCPHTGQVASLVALCRGKLEAVPEG